jgi:hypothetical protein
MAGIYCIICLILHSFYELFLSNITVDEILNS